MGLYNAKDKAKGYEKVFKNTELKIMIWMLM